jgi:uncharacterized protein YcfJ
MSTAPRFRLPRGRQPYDPLNGMRVGAVAGGLLGVIVTALTSIGFVWLVALGAVAGGVLGYRYEKRRLEGGDTSP